MKQRDLLKAIADEAKTQKKALVFVRHGSRHDIWRVESAQIEVPRHTEIGEKLTKKIFRDVEPELGQGWWRK
jgi:mRNA interferase HicA